MRTKYMPPSLLRTALLLALAALVSATGLTADAFAYGGGGGGSSGGGSVMDSIIKNPGTGGGNTGGNTGGGRGNWGTPPGTPPPPPDGFVGIDLVVPIRIEPVTIPENEPVELVEIVSGIGGHPTSGYIEVDTDLGTQRTFVLVDYRDIVKIVYDPDMGWVGISKRWSMKIPLPMTGFIRQIIANALQGKP